MNNQHSIFFLKNGTSYQGVLTKDIFEQFFIEQVGSDRYIYDGDSVLYEIDAQIADIRRKFIEHIFIDINSFYNELPTVPIFISEAGLSSSSSISKDDLIKLIEETQCGIPNLYKHLYLEDVYFILSSIQNLVIGMNYNFIQYFKSLALVEEPKKIDNGTYMISGEIANIIQSTLGSYFVKAHSILDLLTKIGFELECKEFDLSSYPKLKCSKILFGDKRKLKINNSKNTVFFRDELINTIESLRNEIIHNGSWEMNSKVFMKIENFHTRERFVYFPDMQNGNWTKFKNRYHFFSSENTVNNILPAMHIEFLNRISATLLAFITI